MVLGMVTSPMTLMWLRVGARAAMVALRMRLWVASQRLAPSSSHCSRPSLPEQCIYVISLRDGFLQCSGQSHAKTVCG